MGQHIHIHTLPDLAKNTIVISFVQFPEEDNARCQTVRPQRKVMCNWWEAFGRRISRPFQNYVDLFQKQEMQENSIPGPFFLT